MDFSGPPCWHELLHTQTHTRWKLGVGCVFCLFFFEEEEDFKEILTLSNIFLMFYFLHNL